jgi:hypothetical protein
LILAIGLCWLAGGNLITFVMVYGVSYPSVYVITKTFLDAVNSCTALSIKIPTTNKEKQAVMNGFLEKSEQQLLRGCIGAIDGYLQPCDGFPQAYWSGYYMSYGLNVQAVCEH